tara:strand:+ start:16097 stop:16666 length:570 start_codon:yes stop_codon:yes gene_type:complete
MSQIKLKHSGGNSVIIAAPDSNPASDRTLKLPSDGDGTILTTNSATGKILQVVQAVKNDTATFTTTSFTDITGLSASITPTSSSNKILVEASVFGSTSNNVISLNLVRGSTNIAQPSATSNNNATTHSYVAYDSMHSINFSFLDTPPDTNSQTYKIQVKGVNTLLIAINRYVTTDYYAISTLTLKEVAT